VKYILIVILLFSSLSGFAQEKPIITVLDFKIDGVSTNEMRSIISFLSSALFKTGKFVIIDVQERETLLEELEFSMNECSDESCLLEIGRLLAAEYIVTGNIGKVGSRYLLSIKMLETETGRTKNSVEGVYSSIDDIVDDLYTLAAGLAESEDVEVTEIEPDPDTPVAREDEPEPREEDEEKVSSTDTMIEPDTREGGPRPSFPRIAFGACAGVTIPLGELNPYLGITFTPFAYVDYLFPSSWGTIGAGILFGYQSETTTSDYPDDDYTLHTLPLALHSRFTFNIMKSFFLFTEVSAGGAVNSVDYEEGAVTEDLVTTKPFFSPGAGLGISLGPSLDVSFYNNIFFIMFNKTMYSAYSAGLACELHF
jgi:TolB-like protein